VLLTGATKKTTSIDNVQPADSSSFASIWYVATDNTYQWDLMGYGPAVVRYYQINAGGACALSATQMMSINAGGTSPVQYASHPVVFTVAPTSISVTRGNASAGAKTYPNQ
jgi:hypothetical protein